MPKNVVPGVNDLQARYPEIAAEAHGWDPTTIMPGSSQKRDWKCTEGHIYSATVNNRTNNKSGCPVCAGNQILEGFNDLKARYPEIAAEAYGWDPTTVMPGSNKKKDWRCSKGHVYSSVVSSRTGTTKTGCPVCSGKQVLAGFNDLQTRYPEIAAEAHGWDPTTIMPGSIQKRDWKCTEGHIFSAKVNHRTSMRSGCPFCSGKQVLIGFNDLQTRFPEIAAEAYGWDPQSVTPGSGQKKDWRCSKGHVYASQVIGRTNDKSGCPVCSGRQVLAGFNDLQTRYPEIAAEAYGWDPTTVMPGSIQKRDWKCKEGHIYFSTVDGRTSNNRGCPVCSGRQVLAGFNDLQTRYPEIAAEAYGWDPTTIMPGTVQKKHWKCKEGHVYSSSVDNRTNHKSGCPICDGKQVLIGFNDLLTSFPEIAAEAYGWDPKSVTPGSGHKKEWKCKVGHVYASTVSLRTAQETGCPICSGKQVLAGFNDLQTKFPEIAAEAYGWDPKSVTPGSGRKKEWKCKEGHVYASVVSSRTNGTGCPICAEYGFNPEKDACFYLMGRPGEQQLGITNELGVRRKTHERNGWVLLDHTEPSLGQKVLDTEKEFKKWLKKEIGLIQGTTENWSTTSMEVQSLAELKARSGIKTDLF